MNHSFDIDFATKYGIAVATFLNNIAHWTAVNIANRRNYYDGRYWLYNTRKAFMDLFPYWNENQLRNISKKAKEYDLLLESNYNKNGYDKTIWYSLTDKALEFYKLNPTPPDEVDRIENAQNPSPDSFVKNNKSSPVTIVEKQRKQIVFDNIPSEQIMNQYAPEPTPSLMCEKSHIEVLNFTHRCVKNHKPIPNSKTDDKQDTTTTADQNLSTNSNASSEPVVVVNLTSSTSTANLSKPISDERKEWIKKLSQIYDLKPFVTNVILCKEDFIDAGLWSLDRRGEIHPNGKLKGIKGLVMAGDYDGEPLWITDYQRKKNSLLGDKRKQEIINHTLKRSKEVLGIKDTAISDPKEARAALMRHAQQNKSELTQQLSYAERNNKPIKFPTLPPQNDYVRINFMYEEENTVILKDEKEVVLE